MIKAAYVYIGSLGNEVLDDVALTKVASVVQESAALDKLVYALGILLNDKATVRILPAWSQD